MVTSNTPTYDFMNGWDLIAGTKQKKVNELLQKLPQIPVDYHTSVEVFKNLKLPVDVKILVYPPSINVKDVSGRQVDLTFPISGSITFNGEKVDLPADPKPQSLIATVQLTQIEAELQDKKGDKKTKFDLIFDLLSKDLIVDIVYSGINALELSIMAKTLKNVLQDYIAKKQQYKVASFYLNNDLVNKYQAFIPHLADFTFIKDSSNVDNSNVLILMLSKNTKRGSIFFNHPILPDNVNYLVMINNHLFLEELVYPNLISKIKETAKNKANVPNQIVMSAIDATQELWNIHNNGNIDLDKDHDPWINSLDCRVDKSKSQLMLYLDVKANATFLDIHVDTWVRTWLKLQAINGSINVEKANEDSGHSTQMEWWKWLLTALTGVIAAIVVAIIYSIASSNVPSLAGKFDSVATTTVEWPFQKIIAIKDASLPGHVVFTLDVNV